MKKQLIVTTVYLFFLLALVALIEIVWNQDPEPPAVEPPAATTTPAPTPTGPLTIQITGLEGAESIDDVWAVIISIHAPREGCDSKLYQRAESLLGSICLFAQGEEG